jgi:hypothetical protein
MYASSRGGGFGFRGRSSDWRSGYTDWTNDYPRADRHLMVALRRLTRVNARSVEQPINLEDGDDVYNWPFLFMVRAGLAELTPAQASKLRDYVQRGGFLIGDDIWGAREWDGFVAAMAQTFPEYDLLDLPNDEPVFHTAFDLSERFQIPGAWSLRSGVPYLNGGIVPYWRGIHDEKGHLIVAAWINSDTGDSWEWADVPEYPEKYSAQGFRMVINHILYAMSH